jgi:hypothetical protein
MGADEIAPRGSTRQEPQGAEQHGLSRSSFPGEGDHAGTRLHVDTVDDAEVLD